MSKAAAKISDSSRASEASKEDGANEDVKKVLVTTSHAVKRQVEYIQQALSQNQKPLGFFIAAGCPLAVRVNHRTEGGKANS